MFTGFTSETFEFFMQIAFNNNKAFYEQNKDKFISAVKEPLVELEKTIAPTILLFDDNIKTGKRAISRIYRDVRFSKDKSPFRDHMWIGYMDASKDFGFYFEISPVNYTIGMGVHSATTKDMENLRKRIAAKPNAFQKILDCDKILEKFEIKGENYKHPKYTRESPEFIGKNVNKISGAMDIINKKYFYLTYSCNYMEKAKSPELAKEIIENFVVLAPLYKFLKNR